ncbi:AAA family ATPase [Streptomyces sp. MNU89]|uniref:AAA family ATPase n=1 Tax=Streptomyces sp. MNU89 TaxID=2560025 RepID=UPI001E64795A|nr:AAA family ATPase [Streptomyces sp. MNU89]MCC9742621.1 AAA family ATPase [Streptomyces sp. MNU89]
MQHATGAPLPPPHGPVHPSWAQGGPPGHPGHQRGPVPPGRAPVPPGPPGQAPPGHRPPQAPPGSRRPRTSSRPPAHPTTTSSRRPPAVPAARRPPPHQAPPAGPHGAPGQSGHHAPPSGDATGHLRLPAGAPVPAPGTGPGTATPDAAHAAVAVLLIGPAGAGKTTVARHWADSRRVPTAHISLDDVREWVRSGFADPRSGWNDHSEAQYRLARRTCGFAARNFLANGISCILDDAVFPDRPAIGLGGWKRHVGPGLVPVVLLPGLEIVLERNAARSGTRRLTDEEVARIHGRMAGWYGSGLPIIDNSQYDVATTARALDDAISRSLASPPQF